MIMRRQSAKNVIRKQTAAKTAMKKPDTAGRLAKRRGAMLTGMSPEERHRIIAETAYLIAERRGFAGGTALDDWLKAEAELEAEVSARH